MDFDDELSLLKVESLKKRLATRIARRRDHVFFRADFNDLGNYSQVGRTLRTLVQEGRLVKLGYGLYVRARPSLLDGKPTPTSSLGELAVEILGRLGVETAPTAMEEAYNSGRSVQVPTGRVIGVRGRVRRKIGRGGVTLVFERIRPAPVEKKRKEKEPPPQAPITRREALRQIWQADCYPVIGNEDWRVALMLDEAALVHARHAIADPADPPEFARWLAILLDPALQPDERDDVLSALHDLFDPDDGVRSFGI